jgi:hypothetical protein
MNVAHVQLAFEAEGLDPHELAKLSIFERRRLYDAIALDLIQRQVAEEAVRLVLADQYRRGVR